MRSWWVSRTLCFLRPALLALLAALPQSALVPTASQVYEQVKDSVVVVKAYDQTGKPVGLGSGVMLPSGSRRGACSSSTRLSKAYGPPLTAKENLFKAPLGPPAGLPLTPGGHGRPLDLSVMTKI